MRPWESVPVAGAADSQDRMDHPEDIVIAKG